ncbi:DUF960 domain-containing protein [Streptococcus halichoeri]|uniref:DUF960 domain-containing protein n=1 Tax=Streptococcus halichoeri TaxID=254785 RepID=UPI000DB7EB3E|nr:DUF960 domain-containing protein [Streptococcus halichoeri]PZO93446.1 MAG: hypothetical protein DI617_08730 [Streptococcus pyogenes]
MAFQNTKERYASFGVATTVPPELIDTIWDIIDRQLKGLLPLDRLLVFQTQKQHQFLSIAYINQKAKLKIVFDYHYPYDPFLPKTLYAVDNHGIETILLPHEL